MARKLGGLGLGELEGRRLGGFEALGAYRFWGALLGQSPGRLGAVLEHLGTVLKALGAVCEHLWSSWNGFGWPCEQA